MTIVLLIILLLVTVALVGVILMQRSEGGALGIGGGGPGGMMSGASAANLLTRTTMILGIVFMGTCIVLAILSGADPSNRSVTDELVGDGEGSLLDLDSLGGDEGSDGEVPTDNGGEEPASPPADVPGRSF
jgi:preprotein translocase subunit SecG